MHSPLSPASASTALVDALTRERISVRTEARFWAKVEPADSGGDARQYRRDCLVWTGARQSRGYGCLGFDGRIYLAHRVAWVLGGRELDASLTLDHLCRNKLCVNVQHLEQVTGEENSARYGRSVVVCKRGHELAGDNIRIARGRRICKTCVLGRRAADRLKPLRKCAAEGARS